MLTLSPRFFRGSSRMTRLRCPKHSEFRRWNGSVRHSLTMNPMQQAATDRKTSIICTVGPATSDRKSIRMLLDGGMNALRLNFSHGDHEQKRRIIADLRGELEANISAGMDSVDWSDGSNEQLCAILADLKGPEIRTGRFDPSSIQGDNPIIDVRTGSTVSLTTDPIFREASTSELIFVDFPSLHAELEPGQQIFVDDGLIELRVESLDTEARTITCAAVNGGRLGERKGINLPGAIVSLPAVTDRDKEDLRFCVAEQVDYVAASFVRCASHVEEVRRTLEEHAKELGLPSQIKIISKIENLEGCENFDDILSVSDGVMVARGDLGIEIPSEKVFLAQKSMITKCNVSRKLVICATQMLESMVEQPRPTRAEASDVANAVLDGADCVMLSGETAKGKYPEEAVAIMGHICREAERAIDNPTRFAQLEPEIVREEIKRSASSTPSKDLALAAATVHMSNQANASMIVILSQFDRSLRDSSNSSYGKHYLSRSVAALRPSAPIIYATDTKNTRGASQIMMYRGVQPLLAPRDIARCPMGLLKETFRMGKRMGVCKDGDNVVVVSREDVSGASKADGTLAGVPTARIVTVE